MDWHRLFGLALQDFFRNSPFAVEIELDLSAKKQFLDVLILRKLPGEFAGRLPDGLENLALHNLITFKSHRQPLDPWALKELLGHYVNYRKQISPSWNDLLPEADFRLYAVCARFPQNLARQVELEEARAGVYDCRWGTDTVRVVVASQLSEQDHNAILHLFSGQQERVRFGARHYRQQSHESSSLILSLFEHYQLEDVPMPYTMEDFEREFVESHVAKWKPELLARLTPEERLEGLPAEERLKGLPAEERLKGLPAEERVKGLSAEELAQVLSEVKRLLEQKTDEP